MKIAICAPVHIPVLDQWTEALNKQLELHPNVDIIITDDSDGKVSLPSSERWKIFDYEAQRRELGNELYGEFEQFHKSSACKNFGHWWAYKNNYDIIIGLDSDCIVPENFIQRHMEGLSMWGYGWTNPIAKTGWFPRGFPYSERKKKVAANLGLWLDELDLNGKDRMENPLPLPRHPLSGEHNIATNTAPFSGMNFAVNREVIPALLFLPNFEIQDDKFRRHDDIFGGYIFQMIMVGMDQRLAFGAPFVVHATDVIPSEDAKAEEGMIKWEDDFYRYVDASVFSLPRMINYKDSFEQFTLRFFSIPGTPFAVLKDAFDFWVKAFRQLT